MLRQKIKILAIDPGTRYMGVAFMEGQKLVYHNVSVIIEKTPWGKITAGKKLIRQLIKHFKPDVLVIERSFFGKACNSSLLNILVKKIEVIGMEKTLKVLSYAPTTVRKHICGNGWADKKALSQVIVAKYPELRVYLTQDKKWKERYHQNMFDAVALGLMAIENDFCAI